MSLCRDLFVGLMFFLVEGMYYMGIGESIVSYVCVLLLDSFYFYCCYVLWFDCLEDVVVFFLGVI